MSRERQNETKVLSMEPSDDEDDTELGTGTGTGSLIRSARTTARSTDGDLTLA